MVTEEKTAQEIEKLKGQAEDFLKSHFFYAAEDLYQRILDLDENDKDAHLGILMSKTLNPDEESLIAYYQELYVGKIHETRIACEKDEDHIDRMCEFFSVEGYLAPEEIARLYRYDLSYESLVACREEQKEKILDEINKDVHLSFLKENDRDFIDAIVKAYDRRITEAKESDRISIEHITEGYRQNTADADEKARALYEDALRHRSGDIERCVQNVKACKDIDELKELLKELERYKDSEEGQSAYGFCLEKIEDLKKKDLEKPDADEVEKILLIARGSLENKKFSQAYDAYTSLISYGNDSEEIHLGILKAQAKIADTDELFEYYKNLYNDEYKEVLEAVKEDTGHIEEMAEKYHFDGYLEKEEIYAAYRFDRTYRSSLKHRIEEERRFKDTMEDNPSFKWLSFKGSESIKKQIRSVYDAYKERIKEAEKEDEKNIELVTNEYRRFLFQTYSAIRKKYELADEKKNKEYLKLVRRFESANDEASLKELISDLKEFGDYKQSQECIRSCIDKIDAIRKAKETRILQNKIDVLLKDGRKALEGGNADIARKYFSDVLTLDKDQPYAYLGLLMIELGLKDEKELSEHYKGLYSQYRSEPLEACKEDGEHIKEMIGRYALPGYLEEEKIRSYYKLDRNYESELSNREKQKIQIKEEFEMNPYLSKIMDRKDEHIEAFYENVLKAYDQRIADAKKNDLSRKNSIIDIYKYYVNQCDASLKELYEQKLKEKQIDDERKYQDTVVRFNSASNDEQLKQLADQFDPDYKDSKEYIDEIRQKITSKQIDEAKESLDALLDKGKELLKNSQFEKAELSFSSYLKYEPDNEEAHLGLAMAEYKTNDPGRLFERLEDLYSEEITVKKEALKPDVVHIEEIAEKYRIHGKLSREQIRDKYDVDLSFDSLYETRVKQKEEILRKIDEDPSLSWLKDHGSADVKERFVKLLYVYEDRIREAEQEDEDLIVQYREAYASFLEETDNEVRDLYLSIISKKPTAEENSDAGKQKEKPLVQKKTEKENKTAEPVKEKPEKIKEESVKKEKKQTDTKKAAFTALVFVGLIALFGSSYYLRNARIIDDYGRAVQFVEEGRYDEAIALFETLGDYKDSVYLLKEVSYKKADQLYKQGKLEEALELFSSLRFDDSEDRASQIRKEFSTEAKVGDTLYFGSYEQDGNTENGAELIEWMVLEAQNGKVLLISRYGIEARPFHDSAAEVYWEGSDLRAWLNNDFMEQAFSSSERSDILQTTLMNSQYDTQDPSEKPAMELSKTRDRVFLLSEEEVKSYLPEEDDRICEASTAVRNSDIKMPNGKCSWWLRSSNMEKDGTAQIVSGTNGQIEDSSCELVNVIRPAMWIKTE